MSGIVKNQLQGQFKDKTKDVQFKSVYTWARVAGFVAALIILGMFWNQIANAAACAFLAMAGALVALGMEAICCFKCCTKTKACATKIDDILSYGCVWQAADVASYNRRLSQEGTVVEREGG